MNEICKCVICFPGHTAALHTLEKQNG